jgi:DNA-3-methyladenine glycosylase I
MTTPAVRCFGEGDPLYERYHDEEWGRPVTTEQGLYERLCLEAFQAGLSWSTVLHKREAFRTVFSDFEPVRVAAYKPRDVKAMMSNAAIIRNRRKIEAAIENARALLALHESGQSLVDLVWAFAPEAGPAPRTHDDIPSKTATSEALAKALLKYGFRFVGPTTAYATMQAAGLINDHLAGCPVREAVQRERAAAFKRLARRD